jgi:hypothetical protein
MAVLEHLNNNSVFSRFITSNEVVFKDSTEFVVFSIGTLDNGNPYANAEKISDISLVNLNEWIVSKRFVSPYAIYGNFIKGIEF